MYIQSVGEHLVQSVQNTSTSINSVQNKTQNDIILGDTVTISTEALELSSETDLEHISTIDYFKSLSEFERASILASVESKTKPDYFSGADEYNINVADESAKQLVAAAESQGLELDFDETVNYIQRKCHIHTIKAVDEAIKMGWIEAPSDDGLDLELKDPVDYLTEEDKAILEAMYNDFSSKGLPADQIEIMADMLGLLRGEGSIDESYSMGEFITYVSNIIGEEGAWHPDLDSETIDYIIDSSNNYAGSQVSG